MNCSLLEQNLQLNSQYHGLKGNLAICERYNLLLGANNHQFAVVNAKLASKISCIQAEISQLRLKAKPSLEQQRTMLVYSAAVQSYSKSCVQVPSYRGYDSFPNQPFWLPENIWREHYPGINRGRAIRENHFKYSEVQRSSFAEPCLRAITQLGLSMLPTIFFSCTNGNAEVISLKRSSLHSSMAFAESISNVNFFIVHSTLHFR